MSTPARSAAPLVLTKNPPAVLTLPIPRYLEEVYWWAYVHPHAVTVFERPWLVNLILFGNYGRLRDAALADLGKSIQGDILQVACVYGDLTLRLVQRLAPDATLDVVDILPIQLSNLAGKIVRDERVALLQGNSASLACPDAHYDQALLFFLLHEQPAHVRRATLAEALRVVKPGGKIVIVDYHRPWPLHPLRPLMRAIFHSLEPYAIELWDNDLESFLPQDVKPASINKQTYFGGLYQKLTLVR